MEKEENVQNITPEPVIHYEDNGKVAHNAMAKKGTALAIPLAIVVAGLLIATSIILTSDGGIKITSGASANAAAAVDDDLKILADDHVLGNKKADVALFVWSDPECPFCKRHNDTLNNVLKEYNGKIAIVYRHFALDFHEYAKKEAESMECAAKVGGEEGFAKYMNKLFETTEGNNSLKRADLTKIATMVNLDTAKFDACVESGEMAERVQRDMDSGMRSGVQGTPYTIAVNVKTGKQRVINGAQPLDMIKATLSTMIAK